jgi:membrane fusion protein (multidrug efflux system)
MKKKIIYGVAALVLIIGVFFAVRYFMFASAHISTDDAQVEGNIVPVQARVGGYIANVYVEDNQHVKQGQLLAEIDSADVALRVDQATTSYEAARASERVARSHVDESRIAAALAKTSIEGPKSTLWKAQHEFDRYNDLYQQKLATPQKLDEVKAALEIARSQYDMANQKYKASNLQLATAENQLKVAQATTQLRKEEIEAAQLQLSYTHIVAPVDGVVSKKSVQTGQLIQPGQPLMALVQSGDIWVTANYKETQLEGLDLNNPAVIKVDAYPDIEFKGRVESFGGATGAKFSLIPPDNASGNFVKVVQRISIRIALDTAPEVSLLKPGMSVESIVTKSHD